MRARSHCRIAWCGLLFLGACASGGDLPPSDVLQRASTATQNLTSAHFEAAMSYQEQQDAGSLNVHGNLTGVLADAGRQLSFEVSGAVTLPQSGLDQTVSIDADVLVLGEGEAYIRLRKAEGNILFLPGIGLISPEMLNRWLTIATPLAGSGSAGVTPDPSFLLLQTQAITIKHDRSYERVDDARTYVYDVTIEPIAMLQFLERVAADRGEVFDRAAAEATLARYDADGTIWIDEETFMIRRIQWNIRTNDDGPEMSATISLHLTAHNEAVEIAPPEDSIELAPSFSGALLLPF